MANNIKRFEASLTNKLTKDASLLEFKEDATIDSIVPFKRFMRAHKKVGRCIEEACFEIQDLSYPDSFTEIATDEEQKELDDLANSKDSED